MPDFELPKSPAGWFVAILSALVGFVAGGAAIKLIKKFGGY